MTLNTNRQPGDVIESGDLNLIASTVNANVAGLAEANSAVSRVEDYFYIRSEVDRNLIYPSALGVFQSGTATSDGWTTTYTVSAASAGKDLGYVYTAKYPVTPGSKMNFSAKVEAPAGVLTCRVSINFWDEAGTFVSGIANAKNYNGSVPNTADLIASGTVPDTAKQFSIIIWMQWGAGAAIVEGMVFKISNAYLSYSGGGWFDPEVFPNEWSSTPYQSESIKYSAVGIRDDMKALNEKLSHVSDGGGIRYGLASNVLTVVMGYSSTHDLKLIFKQLVPNNTYQLYDLVKVPRSGDDLSNLDSTGVSLTGSITTDTFGPWLMNALANGDGDSTAATHFTGGVHGYTNTNTGSPTSRTVGPTFQFGGVTKTSGAGRANKIIVKWTNYVQASNTKLTAGGGREVLKEDYEMVIEPGVVRVRCDIEFFEDLEVLKYYGMQTVLASFKGVGSFKGQSFSATFDSNVATQATEPLIEEFYSRGAHDFVSMRMDLAHGLGARKNLIDNVGALTSSGKAYMVLISSKDVPANSLTSWSGTYTFGAVD